MASKVTAATKKKRTEKDMPSLTLAYQLTRKASRVGFDWPDINGVLNKLNEELYEFREALSLEDKKKAREELGDLLFVMVNLARFLHLDPDQALRGTILKFVTRFHYVESSATLSQNSGQTFSHRSVRPESVSL